jgi:hypothetical protein
MSRENLDHIRQLIAQQAARMMAEDGVHDFAYAKKKAGRQLGVSENSVLPTNAEIEEEIRLYHEIFNADEQPVELKKLRKAALFTMKMLERFDPHLTGTVLDGTAGKFSQTNIHLFADSAKDVEMFLLNQQIPFESSEKSYRVSDKPSKDKKEKVRKTIPVFTLETEYGIQKISVFDVDDMRVAIKKTSDGSNAERADINQLQALLNA